jgi:hypothetical protein
MTPSRHPQQVIRGITTSNEDISSMTSILPRTACVAASLAITSVSALTAAHAASFDGNWTVAITTLRGTCDTGVTFAVGIRGGAVYPRGDAFSASGRVASSGAVAVNVTSGGSSANGSGRLRGNSGGGSWRGTGSRGACSGTWSASRSG